MADKYERFIRHNYVKAEFVIPTDFTLNDWRLVEQAWIARRDLQKSIAEWSMQDNSAPNVNSLYILDEQIMQSIDTRFAK